MIYQQDWLMRQIEAMIQAVLAVALGISANEQTATQIEDSSYGKMLEKMIDDGAFVQQKICCSMTWISRIYHGFRQPLISIQS